MDYYVSLHGDDHASGTHGHPWRTLRRASRTVLAPGDGLRLEGGTTFAGTIVVRGSGSPAHPVRICSYGSGKAIIAAGGDTAILAQNIAGLELQNLRVAGAGPHINKGSGVKIVNSLSDGAKLAHIRVTDVEAEGFGQEGIFVGGMPQDGSQSGFQDVRISGCDAHENAYFGIYVTGFWDTHAASYANADVTIERCRAWDNPGDPNYLQNHSGSGILLDNVNGGRITRCQAWNNGALCNCPLGGPVGIWAHAANAVVIDHCESFGNRTGQGLDGGGFDFDGGVTNSIMEHNISRDNDGAGFLLYSYAGAPHSFHGNIVRHCRSENDGRKGSYAGIYVGNDGSGVHDLLLEDNTVVTSSSANASATPKAVFIRNARRLLFERNTFESHGDVPLLDVAADTSELTFRENVYRASGETVIRWGGTTYAGLSSWRAATGQG